MSDHIVIAMITVSTLLGATGLLALLWGVKTGQFDDKSKFIDGALYDGEEELRDAAAMEAKREAYRKKKREKRADPNMPPD